ncbi:MAG: entericidin A/B family lipoprotein [Novosphingobium meiothermophilum]|nr:MULTISPECIES: entericidin A/B family lipoprotein [Novosphingobium]
MMRKLMVAAVLGSVLASLGACNTVKGLGRDIQSVGQAGEKAIN